jgi:hypothetical protein
VGGGVKKRFKGRGEEEQNRDKNMTYNNFESVVVLVHFVVSLRCEVVCSGQLNDTTHHHHQTEPHGGGEVHSNTNTFETHIIFKNQACF